MKREMEISVVIPVFNAEDCLPELARRLNKVLVEMKINYEVILVDDGSSDKSREQIRKIVEMYTGNFKGIFLSRNFGQHSAIRSGLVASQGAWTVVMDCDLQDEPEMIVDLYKEAKKDVEYVVAIRSKREESTYRKLVSACFYYLYRILTGSEVSNQMGNFGIYSRKVIDCVLSFNERGQSFGLIVDWTGFRHSRVSAERKRRYAGKSSYNIRKLVVFASKSIVSYSNRILYFILVVGFFFSMSAVALSSIILAEYLSDRKTLPGWTSVISALLLFSGLSLSASGILGIYVARIYEEVKGRPNYIVEEKID